MSLIRSPAHRSAARALQLVLLSACFQVSLASGHFELRILSVQNKNGQLQNGACCDGSPDVLNGRCTVGQCDTYFRVCLKEYQLKVSPVGPCSFGTASTPVLGGNTFSFVNFKNSKARILLPFSFAWPIFHREPMMPEVHLTFIKLSVSLEMTSNKPPWSA